MRTRSSDEGWSGPIAHEIVAATAPKGSYRAAVVGCGNAFAPRHAEGAQLRVVKRHFTSLFKEGDILRVRQRITTLDVIDTELVEHLARCRAVCYPPRAEDYGLVTLEAFVSRKAVITCVDSGGPAELVRSDEEGLVVEPDPASLAHAFRQVTDDTALAERLGAAAQARAAAFTWDRTIPRLLAR